ncbi:MAG: hypothetical protein HY897_11645 [Deltaproteobacteria bacterium]|nr:hypothetical protein [Deltaproteobacteria bacterium]
MPGRLVRLLLSLQCAAAAACVAAAAVTGSGFAEGTAAGLVLGAANFAAVCLIFRRFLSPEISTAGKAVRGFLAAAKFVVLLALFYLAVVRAGINPAALAAGFTLSLAVPILGALIAAARAADESPAGVFERVPRCRTE